MPELLATSCAAAESSSARVTRFAAGAALLLFALAECGMACLMYAGTRGVPQLLYLLCSLALFAAAVVALRERGRALTVVRVSAIVAAVMLFWCASASSGPSLTLRGHLRDLTPLLAGMLLAAVLLPGMLRAPATEAACNCS